MAVLLTYKKLCQQNKRLYERLENLTLLIEYHELRGQGAVHLKQSKTAIRMQLDINIEKLEALLMTRAIRDRLYDDQIRFEEALKKGAYYNQLDEFSRHFHPYKPPVKRHYYRGTAPHYHY
jgi:hypothetical protein